MTESDNRTVHLQLSHDVALVLFEWIHNVEEQPGRLRQAVNQSAEVVALWALSGVLEKALAEPFAANYGELLQRAQERLVEGHDPDPLSFY